MIEPYRKGDIVVVEVFVEDTPYHGMWVGEIADYYQGIRGEMYYPFNWVLAQCDVSDQKDFKVTHVYECSGARLYCQELF